MSTHKDSRLYTFTPYILLHVLPQSLVRVYPQSLTHSLKHSHLSTKPHSLSHIRHKASRTHICPQSLAHTRKAPCSHVRPQSLPQAHRPGLSSSCESTCLYRSNSPTGWCYCWLVVTYNHTLETVFKVCNSCIGEGSARSLRSRLVLYQPACI